MPFLMLLLLQCLMGLVVSWAKAALCRGAYPFPALGPEGHLLLVLPPSLSDPQPESQRAVTDQLQGRVQGQRWPLRLPEARPLPGGHQLL